METDDSQGLFWPWLIRLRRKYYNGFSREGKCGSLNKHTVLTGKPPWCGWALFLCVHMYLSAWLWTKLIYVKATCANENAVVPKDTCQAVKKCIEFLSGTKPRPQFFAQSVPNAWVVCTVWWKIVAEPGIKNLLHSLESQLQETLKMVYTQVYLSLCYEFLVSLL